MYLSALFSYKFTLRWPFRWPSPCWLCSLLCGPGHASMYYLQGLWRRN